MTWRVEIKDKESVFDAAGASVLRDIADLGIRSVTNVDVVYVFLIEGTARKAQIRKACQELLSDPVIQDFEYFCRESPRAAALAQATVVEVAYHSGVMDPVEESTLKGIRDLGIGGVSSVRTAKKFILHGTPSAKEMDVIVNRVLLNKLIQHPVFSGRAQKKPKTKKRIQEKVRVNIIALKGADSKELMRLSQAGQLFLNLAEMRAIQVYFEKLGRNPTDCELETLAQTWSEHCHHKTLRGNIEYTVDEDGTKKTHHIHNLLKSTIMQATKDIAAPWCISVFHDNSGVIAFDQQDHVCFKVETHNHPSALEPFGGANTGIGGVIRDSMGTGLGAKPIANTDIFCFAPPETAFKDLPEGVLHPKRIMKGVVDGVRDYGNKMGIPTVNGAIIFDKGFLGNPLVYCGTAGIIPKDKIQKKACPGNLIVTVGGRTGRDGIHGATFSSGELTQESETVSSGAVQIGNPIQEKKTLDVLLKARDQGLYNAITDCGAGGFSSAVGEMAEDIGCRVYLEKAPVKYKGLNYEEIWISESQERMVLSVPRANRKKIFEIFERENVEAAVIGEFTQTKRLEIFYHGVKVCDLEMEFLYKGIPQITKKAVWSKPKEKTVTVACVADLTDKLKRVLAHYNVCSKENVIRRYDHEVQGSSVIKPLAGPLCDGPSDASVIRPKLTSDQGIAIANGINILFGKIDPYWMAASCIDEAVRQIICVGGRLDRIAILDNFCWGNPDKPDRLGGLVRCAQGCYDTAVAYRTPFISGKDSLYNEYAEKGRTHSIPGTLLISALALVDDVNKCVTMDFKKDGHLIYIIGETYDELGGSIYFDTHGRLGHSVPRVQTKSAYKNFLALEKAIAKGLVISAHDCSEGGLAVALAEMAFAGECGAIVSLAKVPYRGIKRNDMVLFSESNSRFVVEIDPRHQKAFENALAQSVFGLIGHVKAEKDFIVYGFEDQVCIKSNIQALKQAWQKTLRW